MPAIVGFLLFLILVALMYGKEGVISVLTFIFYIIVIIFVIAVIIKILKEIIEVFFKLIDKIEKYLSSKKNNPYVKFISSKYLKIKKFQAKHPYLYILSLLFIFLVFPLMLIKLTYIILTLS